MRCKIIAEIGWNHMGDMSLAQRMVEAAAAAGADYAKFQTWKVSRLKPGPWDTDGRRKIYQKAELTHDKHVLLKKMCDDAGIKFLTSCFCVDDIDLIRSLTNEVKIPGTECYNKELVKSAIDKFDTVFVSTGSSRQDEYKQWGGFENVYLLHCVSSYPCPADIVNLPRLLSISKITSRYGYSGHFEGIDDAIAAISLGSKIVEKHFTTDHSLPGRDNKFAILPEQLKKIVDYAGVYSDMNEDKGVDFQECEIEPREKYAKRWER